MHQEDKKGKIKLPEMSLFRTHPETVKRVEAVKPYISQIPKIEKVQYNPADFNF
jgi:predicted Zn-dependent protease